MSKSLTIHKLPIPIRGIFYNPITEEITEVINEYGSFESEYASTLPLKTIMVEVNYNNNNTTAYAWIVVRGAYKDLKHSWYVVSSHNLPNKLKLYLAVCNISLTMDTVCDEDGY